MKAKNRFGGATFGAALILSAITSSMGKDFDQKFFIIVTTFFVLVIATNGLVKKFITKRRGDSEQSNGTAKYKEKNL